MASEPVESFSFESPVLSSPIVLQQTPEATIGFKLYPAALQLCNYIEECVSSSPHTFRDVSVLELGSGICALPSQLVQRLGGCAIATDLSTVLPLLQDNVSRNFKPEEPKPICLPLVWGESLDKFYSQLFQEIGKHQVDVVVAADVVYFEELIDPFVQALVKITSRKRDEAVTEISKAETSSLPSWHPLVSKSIYPVAVLSYVQRFKRAKVFRKKLRKYFHVIEQRLPEVVDYNELCWRGGPHVKITSSSAETQKFRESHGISCGAEDDSDDAAELRTCNSYLLILTRKPETVATD